MNKIRTTSTAVLYYYALILLLLCAKHTLTYEEVSFIWQRYVVYGVGYILLRDVLIFSTLFLCTQ